jgi:hypothetical protein
VHPPRGDPVPDFETQETRELASTEPYLDRRSDLPPYVELDHSQQYFGAASKPLPSAIGFSQHADEHRSERPILLPVDQELGEGRVAPAVRRTGDAALPGTAGSKVSYRGPLGRYVDSSRHRRLR